MEKLISEFKQKMYLDGKSKRTIEVYGNSVREFFKWFSDSYGDVVVFCQEKVQIKRELFKTYFIQLSTPFLLILYNISSRIHLAINIHNDYVF